MECWQSGVVEKLMIEPGEKVPVGTTLALIREETAPSAEVNAKEILPSRSKITPRARGLAEKFAIDTTRIQGSGPSGEITENDIKILIPKEQPKSDAMSAMQKVIATAMEKSKREIPHYYISKEIEMGKCLDWLEKYNSDKAPQERIIYATLLIKAVALTTKSFGEFNGFWTEGRFERAMHTNIGIVISLRQGGLLSPAILEADQLSLPDLMHKLTDLVTRARAGNLRSSEISASTITITNLGDTGADSVFGVIYPPQVAIVGFGKINNHRSLIASLSGDHRVSDGHRGSRFLSAIDEYLQNPEKL